MSPRLVVCSKSRWAPAIRREHALSAQAAAHGLEVVFLERPRDVRALAGDRDAHRPAAVPAGVEVRRGRTLAPAHRGGLAERIESRRLRRAIDRAAGGREAVVVATQPWQWPAVAGSSAHRKVFDCADDWGALMPRHAGRVTELNRAIAREAHAVLVASPQLGSAFARAEVALVPNAAGPELLAEPPRPPAAEPVMTYAGTLSERLDLGLLAAALDALPGWRLELIGPCQFAGRGDRPSRELERFLAARRRSARLLEPVARADLGPHLDRAAVLLVCHRPHSSRGQDPMKVYDYAARGRPIVGTEATAPAGARVRVAHEPAAFARAVAEAALEGEGPRAARRAWAEHQTWAARWPLWARAVLGEER